MTYDNIIGIDVSKLTLDVFVQGAKTIKRYRNDTRDIERLTAGLPPDAFVVFEATGGYEKQLSGHLCRQGIKYVRANAYKVRSFIKARGQAAKTDAIDAMMLAEYGRDMKPVPATPPTETEIVLEEHMLRRRQLSHMIVQEKCRLEKASAIIRDEIQDNLSRLELDLKAKDRQIAGLIAQHREKCAIKQALTAVKGIGEAISHALVAELPELGKIGHKQISALAGVAPFIRQSGQLKGTAHISGGRKSLRSSLYMAAVIARRCNPDYRRFYNQMKEKGKPPKVILTAMMRKMLVQFNAKARDALKSIEK